MYRRPRQNIDILSEVNVLNLVDVMLVLLIIFILVAPIMEHGIDVRLPASTPSKIKSSEESITVSIAPPGKIYLNNQRVTLDELREQLIRISRINPKTPLTLRADAKIRYEEVIKVLDGIRNSGLTRIGIATRPVAE
ncbi:MAG: biopolymer transporter ExbD [Candidatus Euphemobacter frigidus]|nr:biopolymer transporter ExbD [Candidatus Euphemobacter frigidus]MDP8275506.1 biopolymer transporter ExbD [Candidatus Euphemobacter frigidus]